MFESFRDKKSLWLLQKDGKVALLLTKVKKYLVATGRKEGYRRIITDYYERLHDCESGIDPLYRFHAGLTLTHLLGFFALELNSEIIRCFTNLQPTKSLTTDKFSMEFSTNVVATYFLSISYLNNLESQNFSKLGLFKQRVLRHCSWHKRSEMFWWEPFFLFKIVCERFHLEEVQMLISKHLNELNISWIQNHHGFTQFSTRHISTVFTRHGTCENNIGAYLTWHDTIEAILGRHDNGTKKCMTDFQS